MTITPRIRMAIIIEPAHDASLHDGASRLSRELSLPIIDEPREGDAWQVLLALTSAGLELRVVDADDPLRGGNPVRVDLTRLDTRSGAGRSLKQPLAKAVGIKSSKESLSVLDCTAGLGGDAWLLASLGCRVLAVERQPVVAALLRDGLRRATFAQPGVSERIHLVNADARVLLSDLLAGHFEQHMPAPVRDWMPADTVYLDPMYPDAAQRTTAQRKPLRVLRKLAGDNDDADELFLLARQFARRRVVVKRPSHAPFLAGAKPEISHHGSATRWDVYPNV